MLLLLLLCPLASRGATMNAASVSYAHVQAAVASAAVGNTVQIPAGSANWGGGVILITRSLTVKGAGRNSTFISNTGLSFSVEPNWRQSPMRRLFGSRI